MEFSQPSFHIVSEHFAFTSEVICGPYYRLVSNNTEKYNNIFGEC